MLMNFNYHLEYDSIEIAVPSPELKANKIFLCTT